MPYYMLYAVTHGVAPDQRSAKGDMTPLVLMGPVDDLDQAYEAASVHHMPDLADGDMVFAVGQGYGHDGEIVAHWIIRTERKLVRQGDATWRGLVRGDV